MTVRHRKSCFIAIQGSKALHSPIQWSVLGNFVFKQRCQNNKKASFLENSRPLTPSHPENSSFGLHSRIRCKRQAVLFVDTATSGGCSNTSNVDKLDRASTLTQPRCNDMTCPRSTNLIGGGFNEKFVSPTGSTPNRLT